MSGMTIVEFLLARIAKREQQAHAYREIEPEPGRRFNWSYDHVDDVVTLTFEDGTRGQMTWAEMMARHMELHVSDPVLLDECAAKREIVEYATGQHTSHPEHWPILELLALPYADHPDYDEAWKP